MEIKEYCLLAWWKNEMSGLIEILSGIFEKTSGLIENLSGIFEKMSGLIKNLSGLI